MNTLRIETLSNSPHDEAQKERARAEQVADQFEAVFVKTLVGTLRQTAAIGGEGGGMFGSGPGADTYAAWFDQNVADELGSEGGIGIARALLVDMERHGEIDQDADAAARAQRLADRTDLNNTKGKGGFDVVL